MSDYPAQDAFYDFVGDTDEHLNASLICGTQSSNVCEDEDYIAKFDLDLLAAELWPESSVAGAASDSAFSENIFSATSFCSQNEDFLGLLFSSGMQPPYPLSHTTDGYISIASNRLLPLIVISHSRTFLSITINQQMNNFQPHDQYSGYAYDNDQQMGVVQQAHQQSGISHEQKFDVLQHQGVAITCVSKSGTSKKRKGYRHRHQRQFLSSAEERDQRSRVLNNEASAIYRKKMRDFHDKARTELDNLEQRNQQLTKRFRLLQNFCSDYKARLEAFGVPVTSSF